MATATTTNHHKSATTIEMTDIAQKFREQLVSTIQQGQKLSVDAAQTWVKAASVLPVGQLGDLPTIPGIPAMPDMEAVVRFYFDVAADLLNVQREFALQLVSVLVPTRSV